MCALRLRRLERLMNVAMGLYFIYLGWGLLGRLRTIAPDIPFTAHGATSKELQATCGAHGYLELLMEYHSDPITAFELLGLDPNARPFFPSENSQQPKDKWYQELHTLVDKRYSELMEVTEAARDQRGGRGDADPDKQYKAAITMCAELLAKDKSRRFYMKTFLPMLAATIRGKDRGCVWPLVQAFHRSQCEATWATMRRADELQAKVITTSDNCR
ncbi:uncharacterized protein B0H64DRAFT_376477 [Chaetomium fimeti]|uniref:Uncharacterized protein n=1 Tax=Chaetomium fimeti TaxID=1854472 RepID=A0AAE0HBM6_9PEZI|nr:hypothetical protein B0H64DRAFT_376477 [Chaetomium fimeti]